MDRIPTGIERLDSMIGGGAPAGSVVLLAGEAGAGAREFLYTAGLMSGIYHADDDLFDLHYGSLSGGAEMPEETHYISMTAGEDQVCEEMQYALSEPLVDAGAADLQFADLSGEYFNLSPVPREWYAPEMRSIHSLAGDNDGQSILDAFSGYLNQHATNNVVLVDSLTDLMGLLGSELTWSDIRMLLHGLGKAAYNWDGLVFVLVNKEVLSDQELGHLTAATHGTLLFEWASGGSERARTMIVKKFRGVLSQLAEENIIRFETDIDDGGFDISDVRKIR